MQFKCVEAGAAWLVGWLSDEKKDEKTARKIGRDEGRMAKGKTRRRGEAVERRNRRGSATCKCARQISFWQ